MIRGNKVKIRDRRLGDARNEYNWSKDPELSNLDAAPPLSMNYAHFLAEYNNEFRYPSPTRQRFAIESEEGIHIGNCSYYNIDPGKREAEMGIMIGDRNHWNKGYGEDTINALIDYMFDREKFKRVYLKTLDWNIRAQTCFKKCGFTSYGRLARDGYTFLLMEIGRADWEKKKKEQEAEKDAGRAIQSR